MSKANNCGGQAVAQAEEENGGEMEKRDALGGDLMCTLLAAVHFPVGDHLNPPCFPWFAIFFSYQAEMLCL